MAQYEDELSEIIVYVSGLRRTLNRKLDDHLFIIEQQRERIEFQQHLIDEQHAIVDELAWQIRDLRDSVRQCCEKMSAFDETNRICCQNGNCSNGQLTSTTAETPHICPNHNNINRGRFVRQNHILDDAIDECVYESVDNVRTADNRPTAAERTRPAKLERQSALDQELAPSSSLSDRMHNTDRRLNDDPADKRKTRYVRPAPTIPPPLPITSPPNSPTNITNNTPIPPRNSPPATSLSSHSHTSSFINSSSNNSIGDAIDKRDLASSFSDGGGGEGSSAIRPNLIKQENIDMRDSIDEYNEELGDIIYRLRQFKDFSTRSNRGSSKNVCSLISDIEGDYLPREEVDEDDDQMQQQEYFSDQTTLHTNPSKMSDANTK